MLVYSLLHLSGYDLSLEDLKQFRQLGSRTPGHPEFGELDGVETTTGPLGQGFAAGVGMAMARKWLAARFGEELFDSKIWVLSGDGCIMEGITHEASSLAGHLKLSNLVYIYDRNGICLDGPTCENLSEDTPARYRAYGWNVIEIDGHDLDQIDAAYTAARNEKERPTLIVANTIIGKGSPNKQGTNDAHGAPLGEEEVRLTKQALGWPEEAFYVPQEVREAFAALQPQHEADEQAWNDRLAQMKQDPEKARLWDAFVKKELPADYADQLWNAEIPTGQATRQQGQAALTKVAEMAPYFVTGSADLSTSDRSNIKGGGVISADDWSQRNFKFGVREFAMAAACYGMAAHGMVQPLCGTFFTFSDYMRNAVRLTALMKLRVFYQWTHDSVFVGEDGPTHQPIEQLMSLRAMPNIYMMRPCDENELKACWIEALRIPDAPVGFILTRQGLKGTAELTREKAREGVARGAYILDGETGACDVMIIATGSEVGVALGAAKLLREQGKTVRVVSMPCWELFEKQDETYRQSVIGGEIGLKVSVEAGVTLGWHRWIGSEGLAIGIDQFGVSGPNKVLAEHFGLTPEKVAARIVRALPVEA